MKTNPCYGCQCRDATCHALCLQYAEWSKQREQDRKVIRKMNEDSISILWYLQKGNGCRVRAR